MHVDDTTRTIPLTRGAVALVDAADYEALSRYPWYLSAQGYAVTTKTRRAVLMHRLVLGIVDDSGHYADHVNGDKLDNRRCNLRAVTPTENTMNKGPLGGTSQFKGVHWHKGARKWRAMIMTGRRQKHLGYFDTEEEAAVAYDNEARRRFGDVARTNFPGNEGDAVREAWRPYSQAHTVIRIDRFKGR